MQIPLRKIGIAAAVVLFVMQLAPIRRDNTPVTPAQTIYTAEAMPANIRALVERSCSDCHSNQTRWPWYSYAAPISWMVTHDVHEARGKLNFSEWNDYSPKKKDHELEEICNEVLEGDMPDSKYAFIHRDARVSQSEREALCTWTSSPHPH
jgi:Haem-binding domain